MMKKRIIALFLALVFSLQCFCTITAWGEEEMRGVWVSTVLNLDYPKAPTTDPSTLKQQADSIIDGCDKMGFNNIFLQVRPCSDAFYKSDTYPWSAYLTGSQETAPQDDFDPLEYWIEEAHKRGIKLHAWINPYRITKTNDTDDREYKSLARNNPARLHPEYIIKYSDGQYYFDPGLPVVRRLLVDGAVEIVENYDVDGIHMDDYFYPGTDFGDSMTFAKYGSGFTSIDAWRRNNVDLLVRELDTKLHEADSDIDFGISPAGIWANKSTSPDGSDTGGNESYTSHYADTRKWAQNGWVDYIAPQIYWNIGYSVADYKILASWWANQVKDCDTRLYIGMATYRSSGAAQNSVWYGTDEIKRQLELNRQTYGVDGEIHFRYGLIDSNEPMKSFLTSFYGDTPPEILHDKQSDDKKEKQTETTTEAARKNTSTTEKAPETDDIPPKINFKDMTDYYNWAKEAVNTLTEKRIVSGVGHERFAPGDNVRRCDFLLMLVNVLDLEGEYEDNFSDVSPDKYYADAVGLAKSLGIVSGKGGNRFDPESYITRQDMMVMAEKALSLKANLADANLNTLNRFSDSNKMADYAKQSAANLVLIKIVNGSKGRLNPEGNTTRAESAVIIYNIYKLFDV